MRGKNKSIETDSKVMEMNEVADKGFKNNYGKYVHKYNGTHEHNEERNGRHLKKDKGNFRAAVQFRNAISEWKIHLWV